MHQIKTYCFCLSQTASNINGKGCAGINAPLTLALSVIRGSQAEHKYVLLRTYLICGILQITASNKVFLYTVFPWNDKTSGGTSLFFVKSVVPPPLCKKIFRFSLLFFANELQNRFFAKKSSVSAFCFLQMSFKTPSLQKIHPFYPSIFCK